MPTNVSHEYTEAEKKFLNAETDEEKLLTLEEMIETMPKHKSAEALRKNIRNRYKKLKEKLEEKRKKKKAGKEGIKKPNQGSQVVLIGLTNSGKSSLLNVLTNANPEVASYDFTTKHEILGTLAYEGIKFQIIDTPAINYGGFNQGLANNADILLIIIDKIQDLKEIFPFLEKALGKRIIIFNKVDLLNESPRPKGRGITK